VILAIDPGNIESGVTLVRERDLKPLVAEKIDNETLLLNIASGKYEDFARIELEEEDYKIKHFPIEMIASYGMPVGKEVFETCVYIGRLIEFIGFCYELGEITTKYIYRKEEKMNLCHSTRAKDSNVIQALVDRFASCQKNYGKGTKKKPGWFYGFSRDIWQAYAVAVTYNDMYLKED
jgi:hypothetical protein